MLHWQYHSIIGGIFVILAAVSSNDLLLGVATLGAALNLGVAAFFIFKNW